MRWGDGDGEQAGEEESEEEGKWQSAHRGLLRQRERGLERWMDEHSVEAKYEVERGPRAHDARPSICICLRPEKNLPIPLALTVF